MKKIFSSFYARLSVLFLILLVIMGAIYVAISVRSSIAFVKEADQRMNANLARSIAVEMEPFVQDSIHTDQMGHLLHYLMVINPYIEIYLLDSTGNILAFFADNTKKVKRERVTLEPVLAYINSDHATSIEGDDPRDVNRHKPFSAAPIKLTDNAPGYVYVILGGEQYDHASAAIKEQFLTSTAAKGLVVALVFTGVLGLLLFFFMTRRLRRVTAVVTGFRDGQYEQRLKDHSQDEFGRLATAFNRMADTIVRNLDDLKQSDDLRRELVANVSHDLRTPLSNIQGYLETVLMKRETLSPDEFKHYLQISLQNTQYLNRLVAELFELSKLNAIHAEPAREPFSIAELTQDVILKFKSAAEAQGVEVDCHFDAALPLVSGDIGLIERALSNLIDNAIRYADKDARVTVELTPFDRYVRIKVSDSGPGIAQEDVPHIFLPYYRGKRTTTQRKPGTGLGLAITKRILELHNSDIHVDSALNQGTTFYFDLARA